MAESNINDLTLDGSKQIVKLDESLGATKKLIAEIMKQSDDKIFE